MKPLTMAIFLFIAYLQSTAQQYWQQQTDYNISVRLDDSTHTLSGFMKLTYTNNSHDTLNFIWFHLWPNAYKNDRTAFSDQLLENGRTDFYFSDENRRGYINRLDFRVNGDALQTEDHPSFIDIIKVILPKPLAPGHSTQISTPFQVKLPYTFSRSGRYRKTYQVTQWFPKPAVYDKTGWHEMPYLDQGEFYSEFGNFKVDITIPTGYIVAATGELIDSSVNTDNSPLKTYTYQQEKIHDFAWFADKNFILKTDSIQLASGRKVKLQVYHLQHKNNSWKNSLANLSDAIKYHSDWIGEYPYDVATVVEGKQGFNGGMEYPTITILNSGGSEEELDHLIFHEVGHNWFYGILGSNERSFPWMDEGLNTYYDNRYAELKKGNDVKVPIAGQLNNAILGRLGYETLASLHLDQPINTPADELTKSNAALISYSKTAEWLKLLENQKGKSAVDAAIQKYFREWQFRHPYPEDFKSTMQEIAGADDQWYNLVNSTGVIDTTANKKIKLAFFAKPNPGSRYKYVFVSPLIGFNKYDGFMLGGLIHNYTAPMPKLRFAIAPLYGFNSKSFNGAGRVGYNWYPKNNFQQIELFVNGAAFTMDEYTDESATKWNTGFRKIVPGIRLQFKEKNARSTVLRYIQFKQFLIEEDKLQFYRDTVLDLNLARTIKSDYGISQLKLVYDQFRVLYPYRLEIQMEASKDFGRLTFTGNYFFNYKKKGGLQLRLFAGKFMYFGDKTSSKRFATSRYHLNMTGPKGNEDYTYSNYFAGRNEFDGLYAQQVMMRDGAFKVRTDFLSNKIGKTDNWLSALNMAADIPDRLNPFSLLPFKIPLKIFADVGTYADVWEKESEDPRFVFDAGLQVSLFRSTLNIYIPLVYSKVYRDYYKSVPGNSFFNRISFSIDLPELNARKLVNSF